MRIQHKHTCAHVHICQTSTDKSPSESGSSDYNESRNMDGKVWPTTRCVVHMTDKAHLSLILGHFRCKGEHTRGEKRKKKLSVAASLFHVPTSNWWFGMKVRLCQYNFREIIENRTTALNQHVNTTAVLLALEKKKKNSPLISTSPLYVHAAFLHAHSAHFVAEDTHGNGNMHKQQNMSLLTKHLSKLSVASNAKTCTNTTGFVWLYWCRFQTVQNERQVEMG